MISLLYIYRLIYTFSKVVTEKKGGKIILDRYKILAELSAHEHSVVWLAQHRTLHTRRVIKGIRRSHPAHSLLAAEATTLMNLSHPGIPSVFDVDEDTDFIYIIEEYIEGITLKDFYLKKDVREEQLLDHLEQICSVLEYLQDRSIRLIQLDLKPENIMISDRVRIIDLGTASREGERTDFRFVSEGYSAPEQRTGAAPGKESDVYSLGKLILFMTEHSSVSKKTGKKLERIAKRCTEEERKNRVGSFVIVSKMLKGATVGKSKKHKAGKAGTCARKIAVIGLARGCGTTHLALSLASTLAERAPVVFFQKRRDDALMEILSEGCRGRLSGRIHYRTPGHVTEGAGSDAYGSVAGRSGDADRYWSATDRSGDARIVADLGGEPGRVFKDALTRFDLVILVGSGAPWRRTEYDFLERMTAEGLITKSCRVIMNMAGRDAAQLLPQGTRVYLFPFENDPFSPGSETRKLFGKIVGGS